MHDFEKDVTVEILDRLLKILPELFAFRRSVEILVAAENGQELKTIIAAPRKKLLAHLRSPTGLARFVAIQKNMLKSRRRKIGT